jgi:hypothetical protein
VCSGSVAAAACGRWATPPCARSHSCAACLVRWLAREGDGELCARARWRQARLTGCVRRFSCTACDLRVLTHLPHHRRDAVCCTGWRERCRACGQLRRAVDVGRCIMSLYHAIVREASSPRATRFTNGGSLPRAAALLDRTARWSPPGPPDGCIWCRTPPVTSHAHQDDAARTIVRRIFGVSSRRVRTVLG